MAENEKKPTGAGKSSFDLIDTEKFFQELNLQKGISFLDVASGRGAYLSLIHISEPTRLQV